MTPDSNIYQSRDFLNKLAAFLQPLLGSHGFRFESEYEAISSGGPFANGYFIHEQIRIGLIYRQDRLGCVIYEGKGRNLTHGEMFKALGKEKEQKLLYDANRFSSYTHSESGVYMALWSDLETVILPFLEHTPAEGI
ncbi:MAG TPA: hypothetical protein VHK69_03555, partial [Chitinophagaceae bacterium]|nr:hypothetical protein [Chitinophagaceae bacterium]